VPDKTVLRVSQTILDFVRWLDSYGETSQDHQDFYASKLGRAAKALYYRRPLLGVIAVAPMVFSEAFFPRARAIFYHRSRLPISDAHYAMGFALLFKSTQNEEYYHRAVHFLEILKETRCPEYEHYGWGYPFHWQTSNGVISAGTPLITTTPYCYEAFDYVHRLDGKKEWLDIMHSIAEHCLRDYRDVPTGPSSATCTYTPLGEERVVNASAYRAFLLMSAYREFGYSHYQRTAERNLNFVIDSQRTDGSWFYAMDGRREFIDHFHTCFVLKALAKIEKIANHDGCTSAIERGVSFYLSNLFDEEGLPKPFSKPPRLTVYRRELYDCAECLNLGFLLKGRFGELDSAVDRVVEHILGKWKKRDGSFRSRKLLVGWDDVPMHRWGQSMMFRSLCQMLAGQAFPQRFSASIDERPQ
jgi:hypothetical protein